MIENLILHILSETKKIGDVEDGTDSNTVYHLWVIHVIDSVGEKSKWLYH